MKKTLLTSKLIYLFSSPTDKRLYKVLEDLRHQKNCNNKVAERIIQQAIDRNIYYLKIENNKRYTLTERLRSIVEYFKKLQFIFFNQSF